MICPLIAAAELNDEFLADVISSLVQAFWNEDHEKLVRDQLASRICRYSYRLGGITSMDLGNLEIYADIQEVFLKARILIDEGRI